ncbi:MAG TPA: carboxypeptidase regulatory-like domain-containing protein, partial [Bryobacteraceae bacterium]
LFALIPSGAPRGFFQAQNMFSPRFGFAYAATSRTVIRGGYGMFFARPQGNMIFSQVNVPPILALSQFENGNLANPGGAAGVLAPNGNITAIDPKVVNGYSEQISLGVQRELPKGIFAEVSYVGTLGRHLLRQPNINQVPFDLNAANQALPTAQRVTNATLVPYKGYSNITQYRSDSTSNYNALQVYLNKRKGNVFFTAGYTYSKALGDASAQGDNPENYLDRHYNYGSLTFDRRHVFVGTYVWSLPRLSQANSILRTAFGSWQLNGVIRLQTGQYYSVTGNTSIGTRRADYMGGDVLVAGSARNINNWINRAAFGNAPDNRLGNAPVGNVEAPGLQTYDLSISKNFQIRERFGLRYQADFFNAFNNANFTGLNIGLASAAFGTLPTAYPPRNIQMQLKLTF